MRERHTTPVSEEPVATPARGGGSSDLGLLVESMGARLGADLSRVSFHADEGSARAAEDMNARAYTVGQEVHFGAGELDPGSADGQRLIAHELVHTVQNQGGIALKSKVSAPGDAAEVEADRVADALVGGSGPLEVRAAPAAETHRMILDEEADIAHGKQTKKDLELMVKETAQVVMYEAKRAAEHPDQLGVILDQLDYVQIFLDEMKPAARKHTAPTIEHMTAAIDAIDLGQNLYIPQRLADIRHLAGLPRDDGHAKAGKEKLSAGGVSKTAIDGIVTAGHQAHESVAALKKDKKQQASAHAEEVKIHLSEALAVLRNLQSDDAKAAAEALETGKSRVQKAMKDIIALEKLTGSAELAQESRLVRQQFGIADEADQEAADAQELADLRKGRDPKELGNLEGDIDAIEDMNDRKTAAGQMLDQVGQAIDRAFKHAANEVTTLMTQSSRDPKKEEEEAGFNWKALLGEVALGAVTGGVGAIASDIIVGEAEGFIAERLKDGIEKAVEVAGDQVKESLSKKPDSDYAAGPAIAYFSALNDELIDAGADAKAHATATLTAGYLDTDKKGKNPDYFHAMEQFRKQVVGWTKRSGEMGAHQKKVALARFGSFLAQQTFSTKESGKEKGDTDFSSAAPGVDASKLTLENLKGAMEIMFTNDTGEKSYDVFPTEIRVNGFNDELRDDLTEFKIGELAMPKVFNGHLKWDGREGKITFDVNEHGRVLAPNGNEAGFDYLEQQAQGGPKAGAQAIVDKFANLPISYWLKR